MLGSLTENEHLSSSLTENLLLEALSAFEHCICFPVNSEINLILIKLAFSLGLLVVLGKSFMGGVLLGVKQAGSGC